MSTSTENTATIGRVMALGFLLATLMAACLMLAATPAHAASTFTVNSTGDAGDNNPGNGSCFTGVLVPGSGVSLEPECTLRAAIQEANATDTADTINFGVPTTGVATISLTGTPLPPITQSVVIDGYTQGSAAENTLAVGNNAELRVRLDGNTAASGIAPGLTITADDCVVRGFSITGFGEGLVIAAADNNTIEGNFVGITPSGEDVGNGNGISMRNGASGNTVGGTTPQARNIVSGNGPSSQLSGTGVGVSDSATTGNKVMGNYIGTTKSGTGNLGNTGRGIFVGNGAPDNVIGDDDPSDGLTNAANIIAFNGLTGVDISGGPGNRILSNSIFTNARLGIDLGGNGVTPNDSSDADTGPNNLQNYPVLSSAISKKDKTIVQGTLDSAPNSAFTVQFFSNPKGDRDEGKKFMGQRKVTTDTNGQASFTFKPARKVEAGLFVTATATNDTNGDTSEFSAPKRLRQ